MIPRWLKVAAGVGVFFVFLFMFLGDMSRGVEMAYAKRVVFGLEQDREVALQSDVPTAAKRLMWVAEGHNAKQRAGSPLDDICNLQRTNVMRDIIAYLRAKTGEDLGDKPQAWIEKYVPKD